MRSFVLICLFLFMVQGKALCQSPISLEKRIASVKQDSAYVLLGRVQAESIAVFFSDTLVERSRWRFDMERSAWILTDSSLVGVDLVIK